jgi:hypothetical protein
VLYSKLKVYLNVLCTIIILLPVLGNTATINGSVDIVTGIVQKHEVDFFSSFSILPLKFERKYSSNYPKSEVGKSYILGSSWRDSFSFKIRQIDLTDKVNDEIFQKHGVTDVVGSYLFIRGLKGPKWFFQTKEGYFWKDSNLPLSLQKSNDGWQYINDSNNVEEYNDLGLLTAVTDITTNIQLNYLYSSKKLIKVSRTGGTAISFSYPSHNEIIAQNPRLTRSLSINPRLRKSLSP